MQESTATGEGRIDTGKAPEPTTDEISQVLDLMTGGEKSADKEPDQGDQSDEAAEREDEKPRSAPKTLEDVGKALGLEAADLYNLEIPIGGDAENVKTLGELKDIVKAGTEFDLEKLEFEENKTAQETAFRKQAQDIADIVAALPRHLVTDDLKERIVRQRAEIQDREDRMVRQTIPSWADADTRAQDMQTMNDYLAEFGFEKTFLDTVIDHRVFNLVRDAASRKARLSAALDQVRQIKNTGHGKSQKAEKPAAPRKSRRGTGPRTNSQVAQVAALINSARGN